MKNNNIQRVTYSVDEVAKMLGIGMNSAQDLVQSGAFLAGKVGNVWKIPRASFDECVANGMPTDA